MKGTALPSGFAFPTTKKRGGGGGASLVTRSGPPRIVPFLFQGQDASAPSLRGGGGPPARLAEPGAFFEAKGTWPNSV